MKSSIFPHSVGHGSLGMSHVLSRVLGILWPLDVQRVGTGQRTRLSSQLSFHPISPGSLPASSSCLSKLASLLASSKWIRPHSDHPLLMQATLLLPTAFQRAGLNGHLCLTPNSLWIGLLAERASLAPQLSSYIIPHSAHGHSQAQSSPEGTVSPLSLSNSQPGLR